MGVEWKELRERKLWSRYNVREKSFKKSLWMTLVNLTL